MGLCFNECLYYLDLFKIPMYLLFKSKSKIPSKFSCFISICINIFLIIFFFQSDLFSKQSPTSSVQSISTNKRPRLNFDAGNMGIAFGLTDNENKFYDTPEYFSIIMNWYYFSSSGDMLGLESKTLAKCNESDFFTHGSVFKDLGLKNALCPTKNNFTLEGFWDENSTKYVEISVIRCDNETFYNKCRSNSEMFDFFQNKYFNFYFSDNIIDANNYESPIKQIYKNKFFLMDSMMSKKSTFQFKKVEFINDDGIIFSEAQKFESFMLGNVETDYVSNDIRWIGSILLYSSSEIYVVNRRYQKLQEAIANLGGLTNSLLILGYLITYLEKEYILFITVINSLYSNTTKDIPSNFQKKKNLDISTSITDNHNKNFFTKISQKLPFIKHINKFFKRKRNRVAKNIFANKIDIFKTGCEKPNCQKENEVPLHFGFFSFVKIKYLSNILSFSQKDIFISKALEIFKKDIDILDILKKINDVDKMKNVIFSPNQLKLFTFLSNPNIQSKIEDFDQKKEYESKKSSFSPRNLKQNLESKQIYQYYQQIKNTKKEASFLDKRLIALVDEKWNVLNEKQ